MEVSGTLTLAFLHPGLNSLMASQSLRGIVFILLLAELGTVVGVVVKYFHARTPCAGRAIYHLEHQERYAHNDTCTYMTCTHLPRHQSAHAICQSCRLFLREDMQLPSTSCCSADQVIEHHAIMSQHKCLVNSEDYTELVAPQCNVRSMHSVGAVFITFSYTKF